MKSQSFPSNEQKAQAEELEGYTVAKDGLTKVVKLSESAIENIVGDILRIVSRPAPKADISSRIDGYLT